MTWNPLRKRDDTPPPPPSLDHRLRMLAEDYINRLPYVRPVREFWRDLDSQREFWPLLLPVLAWAGWKAYREERRRVKG